MVVRTTGSLRRALLLGAALSIGGAGFFSASAYAADEDEEDAIIVTARKRAETLQDVPLAVTAIDGEEIENLGLQDVNDLHGRVPGLYFAKGNITNPTTAYNYLIIRGVGWNAGLEPSVGVFIDGMYMPQIGYDLAFLDLARVEVLRGPQGTLFGRNTQGGAVNLVTRKPDEDFRGNLRLEYAEWNSLRATGSMSGQIADNMFASVAADYARTDGYIKNVVLDQNMNFSERVSVRGVLRWMPTADLDVSLAGDISKRTYNEMMRGVPIGAEEYVTFADQEADDHADNSGAQLNVDYKLTENITLSSISGYRKSVSDAFGDTDTRVTSQVIGIVPPSPPYSTAPIAFQGAVTPYEIDARYISQELRLAGTSDRFDWQVGLYYFDQDTAEYRGRELSAGVAFPFGVFLDQRYTLNRDGWATFGQASWRPLDRLELTFGARYSEESVHQGGRRFQYRTDGLTTLYSPDADNSADNVSLMGSISYELSDNANVYFTYAEGWKAGGFNPQPANITNTIGYDDETSKNYELGVKTNWAQGRYVLNGALFWIDIKDQQVFNFISPTTPGGLPVSAIENAASSEVKGVELEFTAVPFDGLTFNGNVAYNDTEFNTYTRRFSATDAFVMDGLDFENTPEITANASLAYQFAVADDKNLEFYLNWRYVDDVVIQDNFIGATSSNQSFIPSYDRLDGRVSLITDNGWRFTLFVDNILDSFDYTDDTSDPYMFAVYPRYVKPLEPRQVGGAISRQF